MEHRIAIVNSSSFARRYPEQLERLDEVRLTHRVFPHEHREALVQIQVERGEVAVVFDGEVPCKDGHRP